MTPEDVASIKKLIIPLMRQIDELRAAEDAFQHVMYDLLEANLISHEIAQILERFYSYRDEAIESARLNLEKTHPELAAELDTGRDEPFQEPPKG
jgi:hypothetical protein